MVWGAISSSGLGTLTIVRGNINAIRYIQVLQDNLLPLLDEFPLAVRNNLVFQQDNAPPHRAIITRNFLHDEGIAVTFWPPLSPDLNPIENVWGILKRFVRQKRPETLTELEEVVMNAWNTIVTRKLCRNLFGSMRSRLLNVLAHRGLR